MKAQDLRLNEFEIKSIVMQCKDFVLGFEQIDQSEVFNTLYTRISITTLENNKFCGCINSSAIDFNGYFWFKRDVLSLIESICNSKSESEDKPIWA